MEVNGRVCSNILRSAPEESDEWGQLRPFISVPCAVQKYVFSEFGRYVEMLRTPFDEAPFIQNALTYCHLMTN